MWVLLWQVVRALACPIVLPGSLVKYGITAVTNICLVLDRVHLHVLISFSTHSNLVFSYPNIFIETLNDW